MQYMYKHKHSVCMNTNSVVHDSSKQRMSFASKGILLKCIMLSVTSKAKTSVEIHIYMWKVNH